jgi:putative membrane protein
MRGVSLVVVNVGFFLTPHARYMEGRKLWANITISSRNLAQIVRHFQVHFSKRPIMAVFQIWIHVPTEQKGTDLPPDVSIVRSTVEKKTMVNLVCGRFL